MFVSIFHNCEACEVLRTLLTFHLQVQSWTAYDDKGGPAGNYGGTHGHIACIIIIVLCAWALDALLRCIFGAATATVLFSNMMAVYLSFFYFHEL